MTLVNRSERKIGKIKFFCKLEIFSENILAKSENSHYAPA
ncbi:hypothetical protein T03_10688 [Trichinella britovi]|uniref:Uncharacterized protein n=1 Tax=Trichinella britovi TaxID=45882 RepID=A0A0V1BNR3_TRIBR|nr:hypothetical protein T03_10688 [Trichinella britovi]